VIHQLLKNLIPNLQDHLSDGRMASLFCNELPFVERLIAKWHLAKCWHCRVRQGDLEGRRANAMMDFYRDALNSEDLELSAGPRAQFARRLELHIERLPPRRWWAIRLPKISLLPVRAMNPSLAFFGLLAFTSTIYLLFWWQHQRVPDITSNTLLVRAERWDSSNLAMASGVVYQSVRITAPTLTMERSIYRDLEGKRSLKPVKLIATQERLKAELARAGVNWDEPISASDYQTWHDHQHVRADKIVRDGTHLLRLTTIAPDSSVSPQSLTVRDTDFHPVRRTVALRDIGTVEIAELDFKILPWSAVRADVFEATGGMSSPEPTSRTRVLQLPKMPQIVTQEQLDEAELGTRLVLNQLHADNGEQIEIHPDPQKVEVEGVVETDERKRQLQMQLRMVPHVVVSILSVADLKNTPADSSATGVQTASMPDYPSPLEILMRAHGRGVNDINVLAERLFNTALTISQESNAIADLQTRFAPDQQRTIVATATLSELIYSHRERLEAALKSERALAADAQISPAVLTGSFGPKASSLMAVANRNLALSKELIQTNSPATRNAEQILAEMSNSIDDLIIAANEVYGKPQGASTLSGKK
jgi:hypothetical protein